jgi:glutathionyl-hydroquinone reductase
VGQEAKKIVNNESSEIIRMLNTEFNAITGDRTDFYPQALRAEIDSVNERIYHQDDDWAPFKSLTPDTWPKVQELLKAA